MTRRTERRHQQGDTSRQRILEAALEIAAQRGYDGTSVALVTERTGLPASSIYWHFKNKDELLAEVLEHSYRAWREIGPAWDAAIGDASLGDEVRRRFRHAATAYVKQPEFWRLGLMLALEQRVKEPAARTRYIQVRAESLANISDWWSRMLEHHFDDVPADLGSTLGRFHLAAMDGIFVGRRAEEDLDIEWLVDTIASGLTAAAHRRLGVPA